jgi:hypothetical protein
MAEWLKAHAWKAALRLTRQASAKINHCNKFTSGCGVYHSQSVRPIVRLRFLDESDFFFTQPVQSIHQLVYAVICTRNLPLERSLFAVALNLR